MDSPQEMATPFMAYRYCEHEFNFQQINEDNKSLIILGRDQRFPEFWKCLARNDLESFQLVYEEIQQACVNLQNGSVYKPLNGELCLVKTAEVGWARCSYLGNDGTMAKMYLWDFGVTLYVDKMDIRVSL